VWMGNDDYSSTKHMTGGSLPAGIWHNIMTYAHQGIELRQLPGLAVPQHPAVVAATSAKGSDDPRPVLLTRKGTDALVHIERVLDDASQALASQPAPARTLGAVDPNKSATSDRRMSSVTAATDQQAAAARGE